MTYVVVIPSIWLPYTDACLVSMDPVVREQTLVVDNAPPHRNRGVAASWNIGIDRMVEHRADWLVICSAAIRFGHPAGLDFIAHLEANSGAAAVEAAWGIGWHLIAFARRTIEVVGRFDEQFFPGYMEDLDYAYRIRLAGLTHEPPPFWVKVDVDAYVASFAHAERFAGVKANGPVLNELYRHKWGGLSGQERFTHPYNEPQLNWTHTGPLVGVRV